MLYLESTIILSIKLDGFIKGRYGANYVTAGC